MVNPLLSPSVAYLFQAHLRGGGGGGGLIEMGGVFEKGGSFNLEMMMQVSVLHRELEYKEEKLGYKKF